MFDKIIGALTGGLAGQIFDTVKAYFPPDLSPEKKAEAQLALERLALDREKNANDAAREAEQSINERIREHEGTAADLKTLPILGPLMLFLRGAQRPFIGYGTMYLDFQVFSGAWKLASETEQSSFWIINFLVLGFLFGERAVRNVAPILAQMMQKKAV
ncbi:MAG: holin family protein [Sulfuricaulis sp.]|nr:holin family protein [Sulfuricaulis sp.]